MFSRLLDNRLARGQLFGLFPDALDSIDAVRAVPGAEITGEVFIWVSPQFKTTDGERWDHAAHGLMEDKRNGQRRS